MTPIRATALLALAAACAPDGGAVAPDRLAVDHAPPTGLTFSVTDAEIGGTMTLTVSDADPNETIYVVRSMNGVGAGQCIPQIGGQCFSIANPVELHTTFTADATGARTRVMNVPVMRALEGATVCFQAVAIRGTNGSASLLSVPRCADVDYDTDGDGVLDMNDACPTGDEFFDWDQDGTADACDTGAGVPPVYDTELETPPFVAGTFQSRNYRKSIPPNPEALAFVFHGSGGNFEIVTAPEGVRTMNTYYAAGIGFVAIDSSNRTSPQWDSNSGASGNPDWQRLDDLRDSLIASGEIASNTPIYVVGYSQGGEMAAWLGHEARPAWPIRGAIYHHSVGRSDRHGQGPLIPTLWLGGENDGVVDVSQLQSQLTLQRNAGYNRGSVLVHVEERLAPTRFAQSSFINQNKSLDLFRFVVEGGWFGGDGRWEATRADVDGTIDTIGSLPGFTPSAPGKGVLKAIMATHAWSSQSADEEVDFMLTNL